MKSKTLIEKQMQKKVNPELVKTIIAAKKNENWLEVARILSKPRKNKLNINLEKINKEAKEDEIIVIPGKVLSQGDLNKKLKIAALNFSEKARGKLLNAKAEISTMLEEIKKNPEAKKIRILR